MGLQVPVVLPKTHRFTVWVQVKHAAGTGFVGMGAGWTLPTHAIPVCHPSQARWCPLAPLTFHRLDAGCWMLAMLLGYCLGYDALPHCFTVSLVALLPLISLDAVHALYEISMP